MESAETGMTVPAQPSAGLRTYDLMQQGALQVWTSLDPTTPDGKAEIIRHMQGDDSEPVGEALNTVVEVEHVLVHRVEVTDTNTGELLDADRVVLIRPDGSSVAAVSQGIRNSLQLIVSLYGMPPFSPAMHLRVNQKTTRAGRRTYSLTPVVASKLAK